MFFLNGNSISLLLPQKLDIQTLINVVCPFSFRFSHIKSAVSLGEMEVTCILTYICDKDYNNFNLLMFILNYILNSVPSYFSSVFLYENQSFKLELCEEVIMSHLYPAKSSLLERFICRPKQLLLTLC